MKSNKLIKALMEDFYWDADTKTFKTFGEQCTAYPPHESVGYTPESNTPLNELSKDLAEAVRLAPCVVVTVYFGEEGGEA